MSEPLVTVRGEASMQCPPDLATLSVTVHRTGETAEQVHRAIADAAAEVAARLEDFRGRLDSSGTDGLRVAPVFADPDGARLTGYRGSYTVRLVVADFDVLGPLVSALVGVPQVQIDGPWWSLRPQHPLERQVRRQAIADATSRAEDYAAAFAARIVDVVEISDLEPGGGELSMRAFARAGGGHGDVELDFEPAPQTVTGRVTVRFAMSRARLEPSP